MKLKEEIKILKWTGIILQIGLGTLVCKSDMKPFAKALLTIILAEDVADTVKHEIKKAIKKYETATTEEEES